MGLAGIFCVLMLVGIVRVLIEDDQQTAQPTPAPIHTTSDEPPPPAPPGAPVPCDPDRLQQMRCFPADYDPDSVMDSVGADGWECLREGERGDNGSTVLKPRQCEAKDNVNQNHTIRASINYDTFLFQPSGKLQSFTLYASTAASAGKGEQTTEQDATDAVFMVFDITAEHIWQGKPDKLREGIEASERLKPRCATAQGRSITGVTDTTPSGYEITCSSPGPTIKSGDTVVYGQRIEIAPA
ncbi:hypothetical protein GIY23_09240 [Allosaccharopolyspora coralli]|uniref:Uncharacterized protein n=1 Tax=Allosaccharopolyspora coralli TaxID=2665642 RepID=A0A5Q3Q4Y6_9PSEU|nr:hypothetical protein [Allosaccharopolyspora coralli]QGK69678.1 hypothetical protein GIY23_09240 [Allosaccharopolyspora coralli]